MVRVGVLLVIDLLCLVQYNELVKKEATIEALWVQIGNQLQPCFNLTPNVVEATKVYMAHEEQIFTSLAEART